MFKRLFFLSGIVAFVLSCAMMWFWYLPMKEQENARSASEQTVSEQDTTTVVLPDSIPD